MCLRGHQPFSHFVRGHSLRKVTGDPQASHGIPSALALPWCAELCLCQVGLGKACFSVSGCQDYTIVDPSRCTSPPAYGENQAPDSHPV